MFRMTNLKSNTSVTFSFSKSSTVTETRLKFFSISRIIANRINQHGTLAHIKLSIICTFTSMILQPELNMYFNTGIPILRDIIECVFELEYPLIIFENNNSSRKTMFRFVSCNYIGSSK